jgi:hypothetical protein
MPGACVTASAFNPPLPNHFGGARQNQLSRPPATNSHAISDWVTTVTTASVRNITHRSLFVPTVFLVSLYALIAMIPTTAAPTP